VVGRYRLEGEQGLVDRSSAPRRVANRTPADRVAVIVLLRRLRMTAAEIAETLSMPLSTVSAVLTRKGIGRLGRIGLEQPIRYERARPGELVHVDVKKLGRIRGVGHRISGSRASRSKTRINGRRSGIAGWEYVHVAVDDYSRLAYAEEPAVKGGGAFAACAVDGPVGPAVEQRADSGPATIDADTQPSATKRPSTEPTCLGPTTSRPATRLRFTGTRRSSSAGRATAL
jgi:hypothetical protein